MKKLLGDLRVKNLLSYIITFSAIIVLIILVMGTYLYQFYYRTIYNDFKSSNKSYLSSISTRHENDMASIYDIMLQLAMSGSNVEFKLDEAPLKSIELKEQLYRYVSVSQFFNQILFYYHNDIYLYNHTTSVDINRFLEEGIKLDQITQEEFYDLLNSKEAGLKILKEQRAGGYLLRGYSGLFTEEVVIYLLSLEPKKNSTIVYVVDNKFYDKVLKSHAEELRNNYIFYKDQLIVSRGDLNIDSGILLEEINSRKENQFQCLIDNQKYLVSVEYGENGLLYTTVQSMRIFQNKIVTGQWGILFILLICSIPTSLVIVILSMGLSKKVRSINALLSEGEENSYDLDQIESGIRTLVEHNKEVKEESVILRRTKFINNFVRNKYESREAVIENGVKVNLKVDRKYYGIVLMGDRGNSNESKAHRMMLDSIGRKTNVDGFGIHLISKNQSLFVIFGDDIGAMDALYEELFKIGIEYCEDFIMATSGYHQDFTEASKAYLEADTAFDNRLLVDNSRIIHFKDIVVKEQVDLLPDTYIKRLKNAIRTGDKGEAKIVIDDICNHLKTSGQSLLTFRILCNDIAHMMIKEWNKKNTDFENIYNVFTLSQCLTIQDFNDILLDICCKLLECKEVEVTKQSDMVAKAIEYMKNYYHNPDLNMSLLADKLGISGVTLAVEFKNAMGISPSDYLAMIRIENAKQLLRDTQLLVKEVSLAVGYEDDNVFSRRFKKYVGKTPGQYRMEY
ncbi:MAG: helix-turn-helix transcriptional regulator [Clostridiales bacterium]|nr:helix-turn-helix transcriptional regulator [Clostridiales bacterium]